MPSVTNFYRSTDKVVVPPRRRSSIIIFWVPPLMGFIKINVDGSFYVEPILSQIGGLFRNHSGNMLLHFVKKVVSDFAIHWEIIVFQEDLIIAAASHWLSSFQYLFESDSTNVVTWFKDSKIAPYKFRNTIRESIQRFSRHISWIISHIRRTGNEAIDILTRMGAHSTSFIEFV